MFDEQKDPEPSYAIARWIALGAIIGAAVMRKNNQYFTKAFRSGDFPGTARRGRCSRFLAERLTLTGCFAKLLLRFRDLLNIVESELILHSVN
jgi:hypothetical protein